MGDEIMEFKNYKEKQAYFKERSKQVNKVWDSQGTINYGTKENPKFKGRTYVKPKEENHDNDSK
jgi:hypothetical protein